MPPPGLSRSKAALVARCAAKVHERRVDLARARRAGAQGSGVGSRSGGGELGQMLLDLVAEEEAAGADAVPPFVEKFDDGEDADLTDDERLQVLLYLEQTFYTAAREAEADFFGYGGGSDGVSRPDSDAILLAEEMLAAERAELMHYAAMAAELQSSTPLAQSPSISAGGGQSTTSSSVGGSGDGACSGDVGRGGSGFHHGWPTTAPLDSGNGSSATRGSACLDISEVDPEEAELWRLMVEEIDFSHLDMLPPAARPGAVSSSATGGLLTNARDSSATVLRSLSFSSQAAADVLGASSELPAAAAAPAFSERREGSDGGSLMCPLCCTRPLLEHASVVICRCGLRLDTHVGLTLRGLSERLAAARTLHGAHCSAAPRCTLEDRFGVRALYMGCKVCGSLALVL